MGTALFWVKFQSFYSHWPTNELQMYQTPETRRGTVEGETTAMVNKDERGPKNWKPWAHLFRFTNKPDKLRHKQMHCVTGSVHRVHIHEQTCARAHSTSNGASQDSEQNTGKGPRPTQNYSSSNLETKSSKKSMPLKSTDLSSTIFRGCVFRCVCVLVTFAALSIFL